MPQDFSKQFMVMDMLGNKMGRILVILASVSLQELSLKIPRNQNIRMNLLVKYMHNNYQLYHTVEYTPNYGRRPYKFT